MRGRPWFALLLAAASLNAGEPHHVTFRDGSVLPLELSGTVDLGGSAVPLATIEALELSATEPGTQLVAFLQTVERLAAPKYWDRQRASEELLHMLDRFSPLAQSVLEAESDPEVRVRLLEALGGRTASRFDAAQGYDRVDRRLQEPVWFGNLGPWQATGTLQGATCRLDRTRISRLATSGSRHLRRYRGEVFKRVEERPKEVRMVRFDKAPDGKDLKAGDNVETLFQPWGLTLSTSVETSFVGADSYVVRGESAGLSAATRNPRWEGQLTARFHVPGHPDIPAGVHRVGCWVSAVRPNAIHMELHDLDGGIIGSVVSRQGPVAFLGAESSRPIGSIRIVPDVKLDRNYALDDLYFDLPLAPTLQPAQFGIADTNQALAFGDRLSFDEDEWTLSPLTCGLPAWKVPSETVHRIQFQKGMVRAPGKMPALMFRSGEIEALPNARVRRYDGEQLVLEVDDMLRTVPVKDLQSLWMR